MIMKKLELEGHLNTAIDHLRNVMQHLNEINYGGKVDEFVLAGFEKNIGVFVQNVSGKPLYNYDTRLPDSPIKDESEIVDEASSKAVNETANVNLRNDVLSAARIIQNVMRLNVEDRKFVLANLSNMDLNIVEDHVVDKIVEKFRCGCGTCQ